ncbi:MAG: endo-1,3-beta-xylanase [Allomuricauda sp.]|nr:MAG: endo-1,3-beta-xylanase [Allomuricauda sp.]
MKRYVWGLVVIISIGCQNENPPEQKESKINRQFAKFEPKEGVLLFVGQELEAVGAVEGYTDGYLDHFPKPAGWTSYSNINPGENSFGRIQQGLDGLWETHDWGDNDYNAMLQHNDPDYENMALAIGLQFVNHEEKVADGTHDKFIDSLGIFLKSLGKRPVFLRIAYEFDGDPWNHYEREPTVAAYRRIVDRLRAQGVENTAYVWQSVGFISGQEQLEGWYPGDDYVDWCATSFFNRWKEIEMFEFARKKGKPVFIAEASPTISDYFGKLYGETKETQLSNPEQAEEAWQKWFLPFFNAINENADVIKAVHYINCHWDSHPMWLENPTFKGIDARLQLSDTIGQRWLDLTSKAPFILSSEDLYEKLYNNQ